MNNSEIDLEGFGLRLKKYAKLNFNGIGGLASKLDMQSSQISNYTGGKREPRASFLYNLALLGCDINWLLTGEEKPEGESNITKSIVAGKNVKGSQIGNSVNQGGDKLFFDRLLDEIVVLKNRIKELEGKQK